MNVEQGRLRAALHSRPSRMLMGSLALCVATFGMMPAASAAEILIPRLNMGTAASYAILAKSGISTTGNTAIFGSIGVSPIGGTAVTGFGLTMDPNNRAAWSSQVIGYVFAANYATPTPSRLTTAISDMQIAYTNAAGRKNPNFLNLGAGNLAGRVLKPGLYKWTTGVTIPNHVTLSGTKNAVWIFQIAGNFNISAGKQVFLSGGAQEKNIFWQVSGGTVFETTSRVSGNFLSKTAIVMKTGSRLNGRALSQTAVTLDAVAVIRPAL